HDLVDKARELSREIEKVFEVKSARRKRRVDNRIITPNDTTLAELPLHLRHMSYRAPSLGYVRLECARITVNGVLDKKWIPALGNVRKIAQERPEILRPEDEAVDRVAIESDSTCALVIRVHNSARAGIEPTHEPLAVECRYVCLVARRDDHGSYGVWPRLRASRIVT